MKQIISTPDAPAAIGPYSQAVLKGDTLYCSGQIAIIPGTGSIIDGSVTDQTEQVIKNLGAVLRAAGMGYADVVQCTVYLDDMANFAEMNAVYGAYFSVHPPARATVAVAGLPKGVQVEIACTARR